jgi:hypothetical protein
MIHTLLKISNNLDQKPLHLIKENEDKAKGFAKLKTNKKQLILNTSEHTNSETSPKAPSEFCRSFLQKTTVFRAKDALQQAIKTIKDIVFFSSTAFTSKLYTIDLI